MIRSKNLLLVACSVVLYTGCSGPTPSAPVAEKKLTPVDSGAFRIYVTNEASGEDRKSVV